MDIQGQIEAYMSGQAEPKRSDMRELHRFVRRMMPGCRLWFLDGKNSDGKTVSNPNIGYGQCLMEYVGGKTREFYQIGMSANTTGISIYIIGVKDKEYLANLYGAKLGKASISGYCVKFRKLADIRIDVLGSMLAYGLEVSGGTRSTPVAR